MFRFYLFFLVFILFFLFPRSIFAESPYVLPYPSAMPGSIFYNLNLIQEGVLKYWYFGDFGRFKYNLAQSDKYLVEAKTLFDYRQYLLAYNAVRKSDQYFEEIEPTLILARRNGKNITEKQKILKEAAKKHIEEIAKLKRGLPSTFEWRPEKQQIKTLNLSETFDNSITLRQLVL